MTATAAAAAARRRISEFEKLRFGFDMVLLEEDFCRAIARVNVLGVGSLFDLEDYGWHFEVIIIRSFIKRESRVVHPLGYMSIAKC